MIVECATCVDPLPWPPLTAPAFAISDADDPCLECVDDFGLCDSDRCRRAVLPQLAKPALLSLIGVSHVEQTKRQTTKALPVSEEAKAHKARKDSARKIAKSKRRGYFGLAKAIMAKKHA